MEPYILGGDRSKYSKEESLGPDCEKPGVYDGTDIVGNRTKCQWLRNKENLSGGLPTRASVKDTFAYCWPTLQENGKHVSNLALEC